MGDSGVSCAITTEPIEMPFEALTQVDLRNRVLDGDHDLMNP